MGEHLQLLAPLGQLEHPEGASDIAVNGVVESGVEVDAGRAVDDDIAGLHEHLVVLRGQAQAVSEQVALAVWRSRYMGTTLLVMNSSNLDLWTLRQRSKHWLLMISFLNLS